jgi:proline dehydrogenase
MNYPWMVKAGTFLTSAALKFRLPVKGVIKKTLFDQFCGGESFEGSEPRMIQLAESRVKTILDYSVEGEASEEGYDEAVEEAIKVAEYAKQHESIPFCVIKVSGLGSTALLEKVQKKEKLSDSEALKFERVKVRLDTVVSRAASNDLKFMIDAEESWYQDVIDDLVCDLMIKYNQEKPYVYNTYQLYRHEALGNMKKGYEFVARHGAFFAAKLVRGAYMERERDRAEDLGYTDPIQPSKAATDNDYNDGLKFAVEHIDEFSLCAGTHNEASCQYLIDLMAEFDIKKEDERVYFAQLLGMSDNISFKLSDQGYNVAKYVPYGPVEKVLPYLFRRADENTSIAGQSSREFMLVKKELKRRKSTV